MRKLAPKELPPYTQAYQGRQWTEPERMGAAQVLTEVLESILLQLDQRSLVALAGTCKDLRARAKIWALDLGIGAADTPRHKLWSLWHYGTPISFEGVLRSVSA